MRMEFPSFEETALPQFYGGEKQLFAKLFADDSNRILCGRLVPGASIGQHCHETSSEIIYILEGNGVALCEGEREQLHAGICHYCKKGQSHSLVNDGDTDLVFFAVVAQQ